MVMLRSTHPLTLAIVSSATLTDQLACDGDTGMELAATHCSDAKRVEAPVSNRTVASAAVVNGVRLLWPAGRAVAANLNASGTGLGSVSMVMSMPAAVEACLGMAAMWKTEHGSARLPADFQVPWGVRHSKGLEPLAYLRTTLACGARSAMA